jgi:hypothetical protein
VAEGASVAVLRWRTRAIGCLLPLMMAAAVIFAAGALLPSVAASLSESGRGSWMGAAGLTIGSVNLPMALFALAMSAEVIRQGWRWADEVAARATPAALVPHRSTFLRPIPWSEIRDVRIERTRHVASLVIVRRRGGTRTIRNIDDEDGAGDRFMEAARARLLT